MYTYSLLSGDVVEQQDKTKPNLRRAELYDLRPNTNYRVMVAGVNKAGLGPFSSPEMFTTPGGKGKLMESIFMFK